jgi:hypothetical protein
MGTQAHNIIADRASYLIEQPVRTFLNRRRPFATFDRLETLIATAVCIRVSSTPVVIVPLYTNECSVVSHTKSPKLIFPGEGGSTVGTEVGPALVEAPCAMTISHKYFPT